MATQKDWSNLKPYEKANRWLLPIEKDENYHVPGLYFWGSLMEEWVMYEMQYEYKIDRFRCTDPWLALRIVATGYALIESFVDEPSGEKVIMLLMKRVY
jgi:hypothetical protein